MNTTSTTLPAAWIIAATGADAALAAHETALEKVTTLSRNRRVISARLRENGRPIYEVLGEAGQGHRVARAGFTDTFDEVMRDLDAHDEITRTAHREVERTAQAVHAAVAVGAEGLGGTKVAAADVAVRQHTIYTEALSTALAALDLRDQAWLAAGGPGRSWRLHDGSGNGFDGLSQARRVLTVAAEGFPLADTAAVADEVGE